MTKAPFIWEGPRRPDERGVRIPPPDHTAFDLYFFRDISTAEFAPTIAQALAENSSAFALDSMSHDASEWSAFSPEGAAAILRQAETVPNFGRRGVLYAASSTIRCEVEAFWSQPIHRGANVVRVARLSDELGDEGTREQAVEAFIALCEATGPDYAYAVPRAEFYEKFLIFHVSEGERSPGFAPCTGPPHALNGIFWLNWFGPSYRRQFGDRRLLSIPSIWARITGKGIAFANSEEPLDFSARPARERAKKAVAHLGARAFVRKSDIPGGWQRGWHQDWQPGVAPDLD